MRRTEPGAVRVQPVEIDPTDGGSSRGVRARFVVADGGPGGAPGDPSGAPRAAVLVAADTLDAAQLEELAGAGFAALVPDPDGGLSGLADRRAGALLEAGLAWLAARPEVDGQRLGVLGCGGGGTHAFLLACTSRRLACAVAVDPRVVRPSLSAEHPVQPVELALNLSCPLAVHYSSSGASGAKAAERLREVLDQFAKEAEVRVHGGDVLLGARYDDATPEGPFHAALAFLRTHLEEPPS